MIFEPFLVKFDGSGSKMHEIHWFLAIVWVPEAVEALANELKTYFYGYPMYGWVWKGMGLLARGPGGQNPARARSLSLHAPRPAGPGTRGVRGGWEAPAPVKWFDFLFIYYLLGS